MISIETLSRWGKDGGNWTSYAIFPLHPTMEEVKAAMMVVKKNIIL